MTARSGLPCEFGREVFAIPGSNHSPQARGCHQLIKQGAKLVESAQDVLAELGGFTQATARTGGGTDGQAAEPADRQDPVLQALGWDPVGIDTIAQRVAGIEGGVPELAARLLALEMSGRIERLADGRFQRRGPA